MMLLANKIKKEKEAVRNSILNKAYNFEGKMSAKLQREIFGEKVFGRKDIKIDCWNWKLTVTEMVAFGQDSNRYEYYI